jgi:surface polysaccharide O-acyltransferase-like enzyme
MYYLIYFTLGNFIKERQIEIKNKTLIISLFTICLVINISMYFLPNYYFLILEPQSLSFLSLKIYFVAVIIMLAGTYVFIKISQRIKKAKFLEYLSHNSLIFFGLHVPVMCCVRSFFEKFNINITQKFNLEGLIYTFLIILILIPISYLINRFIPFIVNRRKGVEK